MAELQADVADRGIVDDRKEPSRIGHDGAIEQRLVVVEQVDQIDVAVEVGRLVTELHVHALQLDIHFFGDVRHEADDTERLLFRLGECRRLVE